MRSRTADLNELSLLISDLLNEKTKLGKTKFIIDSVTPLFTYKEPQVVVQFLASTAVKVKAKGAALAVSLTSGTVNEETLRRLETLMDFALEIRVVEEEGRKKRLMRFVKAGAEDLRRLGSHLHWGENYLNRCWGRSEEI